MYNILLFYVTHPSEEHAARISEMLIDENLIACGNTYPMTSLYHWENQLCRENELVTILKTSLRLESQVENRIAQLHEYDTPCLIRYEVRCNKSYYDWVEKETNG